MGSPAPAAERIEALDILRGMALFGVLVVNLVGSFRVSFLEHFLLRDPMRSPADRVADTAIQALLEGKALTIFAFLFGVGLAIQYERFARTGDPAYWLRRRLLVLLAFGLAHLVLLWNGDILTEYALMGLASIPLLAAPIATLRRWIVRLAVVSLLLPLLVTPFVFPDAPELMDEIAEANRVYGSGTWLEIRRHSAQEFVRLAPLLATLLPQTFLLFLAGAVAWRTGLLQRPAEHRALLARLASGGLLLGGALTAFNIAEDTPAVLSPLLVPSLTAAPLVLAMGYAAALLLALERAGARRALAAFAPMGRMAFTNYLVQSIVFGAIFFGYGLGLFGRLGTLEALVIGLAVYAAQLGFSAWWLGRYRFGPFEWLWRTLTYGARQPMRLRA